MYVKLYILISHIPVLVSMIYALAIFKKLDRVLKLFCCFLILSDFVQLLSLIFWFKSINNLPILHFYVPLGFIALSLFYNAILKDFINSNILWGVLLLFLIFTIFNSFYWQGLFKYNSYALTIESILIIIYSLSTFIFLLNDIFKDTKPGTISSLNWINSGLFIYYASSLIIFYFGNLLAVYSPSVFVKNAWALHAFFSTVMYIFFIIGLWMRPAK